MSAFPLTTDINLSRLHVGFGPRTDISWIGRPGENSQEAIATDGIAA
jgi:hypothetical protein